MTPREMDEKIKFMDGVLSDLINESDTTVEAVMEIQKIVKKMEGQIEFLLDKANAQEADALFGSSSDSKATVRSEATAKSVKISTKKSQVGLLPDMDESD